jgi:Spy/CpxP family protein refolding chaperone
MKKIIRSLSVVALIVSAFALGTKAQTAAGDTVHKHKFSTVLTAQQQAVLKENKQKHREAAAKFKATLTADQKAILKDRALARKDRKAKLEATLTADQKQILAANKANAMASRKAFMATLTDKQKADMKEMFKGRHGKGGLKHRKNEKV